MKVQIIFLLVLFSAQACSHVKFDFNKITEFESSSDDKHSETPPYQKTYSKGKKKLVYIAVKHDRDLKSPTHQMVKSTLEKFKPQAIVIEFPLHQPELVKRALTRCDLNQGCSESVYAMKLSRNKGIKVLSGEPREDDVLTEAIEQGLTQEEVIFLYTYRQIASSQLSDLKKSSQLEADINKVIDSNIKRLGGSSTFTFNDFTEIYKRGMKKDFTINLTHYSDIAPYSNGHYIQKLSATIDKTRERNILQNLEKALQESDKVLIIYGASHFIKHQKVIEDHFGHAKSVNFSDKRVKLNH